MTAPAATTFHIRWFLVQSCVWYRFSWMESARTDLKYVLDWKSIPTGGIALNWLSSPSGGIRSEVIINSYGRNLPWTEHQSPLEDFAVQYFDQHFGWKLLSPKSTLGIAKLLHIIIKCCKLHSVVGFLSLKSIANIRRPVPQEWGRDSVLDLRLIVANLVSGGVRTVNNLYSITHFVNSDGGRIHISWFCLSLSVGAKPRIFLFWSKPRRNAIEFNSIPSIRRLVPGGYENMALRWVIWPHLKLKGISRVVFCLIFAWSSHTWCLEGLWIWLWGEWSDLWANSKDSLELSPSRLLLGCCTPGARRVREDGYEVKFLIFRVAWYYPKSFPLKDFSFSPSFAPDICLPLSSVSNFTVVIWNGTISFSFARCHPASRS